MDMLVFVVKLVEGIWLDLITEMLVFVAKLVVEGSWFDWLMEMFVFAAFSMCKETDLTW
jgi:hypothetical protein